LQIEMVACLLRPAAVVAEKGTHICSTRGLVDHVAVVLITFASGAASAPSPPIFDVHLAGRSVYTVLDSRPLSLQVGRRTPVTERKQRTARCNLTNEGVADSGSGSARRGSACVVPSPAVEARRPSPLSVFSSISRLCTENIGPPLEIGMAYPVIYYNPWPCHAGALRVRSAGRVEMADLTWVERSNSMRGAQSRPKSPKVAQNRPKSPK
jgi:hypothetical protein